MKNGVCQTLPPAWETPGKHNGWVPQRCRTPFLVNEQDAAQAHNWNEKNWLELTENELVWLRMFAYQSIERDQDDPALSDFFCASTMATCTHVSFGWFTRFKVADSILLDVFSMQY